MEMRKYSRQCTKNKPKTITTTKTEWRVCCETEGTYTLILSPKEESTGVTMLELWLEDEEAKWTGKTEELQAVAVPH